MSWHCNKNQPRLEGHIYSNINLLYILSENTPTPHWRVRLLPISPSTFRPLHVHGNHRNSQWSDLVTSGIEKPWKFILSMPPTFRKPARIFNSARRTSHLAHVLPFFLEGDLPFTCWYRPLAYAKIFGCIVPDQFLYFSLPFVSRSQNGLPKRGLRIHTPFVGYHGGARSLAYGCVTFMIDHICTKLGRFSLEARYFFLGEHCNNVWDIKVGCEWHFPIPVSVIFCSVPWPSRAGQNDLLSSRDNLLWWIRPESAAWDLQIWQTFPNLHLNGFAQYVI